MEFDFQNEILRLAPPTVVSGVTVLGLPLHEWVYVLTLVYILVGIATLIKKNWITTDKKEE